MRTVVVRSEVVLEAKRMQIDVLHFCALESRSGINKITTLFTTI